MACCQVKDDRGSGHYCPGMLGLEKIRSREAHARVGEHRIEVIQPTGGQIVHDMDLRPARDQGFDEMAADEGRSAGHDNRAIHPECLRHGQAPSMAVGALLLHSLDST